MSKLFLHLLNVSILLSNNRSSSVLVAIRSQQQMPDDPQAHMMDYFGNYKSPEWAEMQQIEDENDAIKEELPQMEDEIGKLEAELAVEKRKTRLVQAYRTADPDSTVSRKISNYKSVTRLLTSLFFRRMPCLPKQWSKNLAVSQSSKLIKK